MNPTRLPAESFSSEAKQPLKTGLLHRLRTNWPEFSCAAAYAAIVASTIPFHEPFADEAQAWQLARSLSLRQLFITNIRYEASPGLWHFLLWLLIRAHVTYAGLHWVCGAIAVSAISLFVFKSPFPRYLKLGMPFTYFLLFQYAVVARSYTLVPLLLFAIAWQWKSGHVRLAVLFGLLANVSLHCAVLSVGLALVYAVEQARCFEPQVNRVRRNPATAMLLLACFWTFALWTAWPPHDLLLARVRGDARPFLPNAIGSAVLGICQPWIISIPFWIAIALWFRDRNRLIYLIPVLFFAVFSGEVHFEWWHAGLLIPLLLALLWVTWPAAEPVLTIGVKLGRLALLLLIVTQIAWSGYALVYDHFHAFSPDLAASKFLEPLVNEYATIAVTYVDGPGVHAYTSVGILPYFKHNIYRNQPDSFWSWSERNPTESNFLAILPAHPQIVVVEKSSYDGESVDLNNPKLQLLFRSGYTFTNKFCGTMPLRLGPGLTNCHLIFQYLKSSPLPPGQRR
jgi:hypothetical protein